MDPIEALAEELYRRIRSAEGYRQPGNLTLLGNLPQDGVRRENFTKAIRGALEDDLIRLGEGNAQGSFE